MKKILALCLVVVLAVTAVTGATLAYFTDKDAKTNTFTLGGVAIHIDEKVHDGEKWEINETGDFGKLEPGVTTYMNKAIFTYNDEDDAYIRNYVAIEDPNEDAADESVWNINYQNATQTWTDPDETRYGVEITARLENVKINGRNFDIYVFDVIDGEVVKKGELNHVLSMTSFNLDEDFTNEDAEKFGKIEVYTFSEAIQAAGLTHADAMAKLQGEGTLEEHAIDLFDDMIEAENQ